MLRRMSADADPEHEAATAGLLERGRHPGDHRRLPVHHVEDERHEAESARAPGQRRERRPALEDGIAPDSPADEVVPDRDAVVARGLQAPFPVLVNLRAIGVSYAWFREQSRRLEAAGYDGIAIWDHFVSRGVRRDPVLECWTTLAALAGS